MSAVVWRDLMTSPAAQSSTSDQETDLSVHYLRRNPRRINRFRPKNSPTCSRRIFTPPAAPAKQPASWMIPPTLHANCSSSCHREEDGEHYEELRWSSENTDVNTCGRHFLFDTRWTNGMYNRNNFRDGTVILPPVSQEYHIHQSHNLHRFSNRKPLSYGITKPCTFGFFEEFELTSVPSVLVTLTTSPVSERNRFSECFNRNRSKKNKKVRNRFIVGFNNRIQSFPDPVLGAPASFIQRISEISFLQAETVRQEKIKNLKKITRQEAQ